MPSAKEQPSNKKHDVGIRPNVCKLTFGPLCSLRHPFCAVFPILEFMICIDWIICNKFNFCFIIIGVHFTLIETFTTRWAVQYSIVILQH